MSGSEFNIIKLRPGVVAIEESIVSAKRKRRRKLSARQIVKKAIRAIPQNYLNAPFSTLGYYRDFKKNSASLVNLNEAIEEVFDEGFDKPDYETTEVNLYYYKKNMDFLRDSQAANPYSYNEVSKIMSNAYLPGYGGNELIILRIYDEIGNYITNSFDFINNMSER